ncbi:MAG: DMT family transporter [Alphaproteobacteria bacterium]|nr:DMT family transporter [Alphaproteobacteria bacterium]
MTFRSDHAKGLALTALGVLILSPDALLIRLIETDLWTLLFWRGTLMGLALVLFVFLRDFKAGLNDLRTLSKLGWLAAFLFGLNNIFFLTSITNTSAANTLVILGALPLFSAVLGYFLIKERLPLNTWIAILIGFGGIIVIFAGSMEGKGLFGDIAAALTACSMAAALICFRHDQSINTILAVGIGSICSGLFALMFADPLSISGSDPYYIFILGVFILPISMGLITYGPRYLSAAEVSLILIVEMALGPLWVWLGIGEIPSTQTLIGGTIILITLTIHSIIGLRRAS